MGVDELRYVTEAFNTNWIAPLGPNVNAFEQHLADHLGVAHAVSLSSGTAAIHLALLALGVQQGDIVLCQSFTFAASAFPIQYCGATPVFIDSEEQSWNMDPILLEEAILHYLIGGKKPAAIIVVHLYGMPANMESILEISRRFDIPVIEDAAEALGSEYQQRACGSFGDISILSFNGNKIITTSGGGALCTNNDELAERVRHLSNQAKEPAAYYLHNETGYNYRMSNVLAGIGRGQMEVLPERVEKRRANFEWYQEQLGFLEGIRFHIEPEDAYSNRWLTTILFDAGLHGADMPERLRLHLETFNIESRRLWKPLHTQPAFEQCLHYNNGVAEELFNNGLCLPSGSNLSFENLQTTTEAIKLFIHALV